MITHYSAWLTTLSYYIRYTTSWIQVPHWSWKTWLSAYQNGVIYFRKWKRLFISSLFLFEIIQNILWKFRLQVTIQSLNKKMFLISPTAQNLEISMFYLEKFFTICNQNVDANRPLEYRYCRQLIFWLIRKGSRWYPTIYLIVSKYELHTKN